MCFCALLPVRVQQFTKFSLSPKKVVLSREIKSFVISKNVLSRQRDLSRDKKFFHVKNVNNMKWKDLS